MKKVKIVFGVGYGRHNDELEFEDDATEKEIEEVVGQYVMEKLDWGFEIIKPDVPEEDSL